LEKRRVDDPACLFCKELETVNHLFFECVVAIFECVLVPLNMTAAFEDVMSAPERTMSRPEPIAGKNLVRMCAAQRFDT
jgi:hypothetical protein